MVQPYNEILFSNKKKSTIENEKNMNESQLLSTKYKKTNSKDYILYDPIYMKFLKTEKYRNKEKIRGRPALGLEGGIYYKEAQGNFFHSTKVYCILDMVVVTQLYASSNLIELYTKRVDFTVCKLYFNKPDFLKRTIISYNKELYIGTEEQNRH